jgi:hypothetical protein
MKRFFTTLIIAGALMLNSNQTQAQCYSAVQLNGLNQYLHSPFANYDFTNFTVEMWINSADYSANQVFVNWSLDSWVSLGGWAADGSFNTWAEGLSPNSINSGAGTDPAINTWHHVAFVFDGTSQIIYIDGTAVMTTPTSGSLAQAAGLANGLVIGARFDQGNQFSNAAFEDVRIWTVARTSPQLNGNMSSELTGSELGLVAYYRFEDGLGSTTVTDLTGNGHDLTMYNMDPATDWISGPFSSDVEATDVQVVCGSLTWIDGNTYTSNNNTATFTYTGGALGGCDSIVTLDLTVNTMVDASVTTASPMITSNEVGVGSQYVWIDCNNGSTVIPGETGQSFTATTTGAYAAVVTGANGCSDTSACEPIEFASLNESSLETAITVSPNPTSGVLSISALNYSGEVTVEVIDLTGKLIFSSMENLGPNSSLNIDMSQAEKGMYIVNVSDKNEARSIRVVKK